MLGFFRRLIDADAEAEKLLRTMDSASTDRSILSPSSWKRERSEGVSTSVVFVKGNVMSEKEVHQRTDFNGKPKSITTDAELEEALRTCRGLVNRTPWAEGAVRPPFARKAPRAEVEELLRKLRRDFWTTDPDVQSGVKGRNLELQIEMCELYLRTTKT